jgi:hypothetical protein
LTPQSQLAYRNLKGTCKAADTRKIYTKALRSFMEYLRVEDKQYDKLLEKDPKLIQADIIDWVSYLKDLLLLGNSLVIST